jgi:hypothetical protein
MKEADEADGGVAESGIRVIFPYGESGDNK